MTASAEEPQNLMDLKGYFSTRYVYRTTHADGKRFSDQDLYEDLRIDMTMPRENRYEFHFYGTAREDLDGNANKDSKDFFPLEDAGDASNTDWHGYVYEAHLDINNINSHITQARLGRQSGTRDEPIFFDGLSADIKLTGKLNATVYGGAAVNFYEVDSYWGEDKLGGLGIDYTPVSKTGLSFDYLYVRDKRSLFSDTDQEDHLLAFKIRQRFSEYVKGLAKFSFLNGDARDMTLRAMGTLPDAEAELILTYFRQFDTEKELSNQISPFYDIMGTSYPFHSIDIKLRKLFGPHYAVDAGYFQRMVISESDESAFNRDYKRVYGIFEIRDVWYEGLSLSFIGEHWDSGDKQYNAGGFDAGYRFKEIRKASVNIGTYFSLYKYDYYVQQEERTEVRTYYINGKLPLYKNISASGSYEYEDGIEDYQTVKLGIRYDF